MKDPVYEPGQVKVPMAGSEFGRGASGIGRWIAAGFALAFLGVVLGGCLEAFFAYRFADSLGMAPIAGAILAYRIYDLPIPLTAGLAGALIAGLPAIILLRARRASAIKVSVIGFVLLVAGTAVCWIAAAFATTIVATVSLRLFCGNGSEGTINHYFYEFLTPQLIFRSLIAAIVFAVALFAIHVTLLRRNTSGERRKLRPIVLSTVVATLVAGGVLAMMSHDLYEKLGISVSIGG
ncbi:hypothetical protein ACIP5Y_37155 [Nocardia sp. NPDC088792]|uniref:hypothetical protein n=1 Tax=Nocardia sp. NPDC088792 TaxID=3364332 RepID=UPI0037F4ED4F